MPPLSVVRSEYIFRRAVRNSARLRLKRENFAGGIAKVELVGDRADAFDALHRPDHIVELVTQCKPAQCDAIVVGENLDSLSVLDLMIELGAYTRCERMIRSWGFFNS